MLDIRIWDVGAALSARIITPAKQNHIIDAGASTTFSPAEHIADNYWRHFDSLDYLVISHFDSDHCRDLPTILSRLGGPRVYLRNKTVPEVDRYGNGTLGYQAALRDLDTRYTSPIDADRLPSNPAFSGVDILHASNSWADSGANFNDASIVLSYLYAGVMIIFPGDIGPRGWATLVEKKGRFLDTHLKASKIRILVAPHHGRTSGYSQDMIDYLRPSAVVVSDAYGAGPTDSRFYRVGGGLLSGRETRKLISTKLNGRTLIKISDDGSCFVDG